MVSVNAASTGHRHRRAVAAIFVFVLVPLAAAGYYFGYNVGTLTLVITDDAIDDFTSLNITFSEVQVHSSGALTLSAWTSIPLATTTVDLKRLSDNLTMVLGLGSVPAGTYSQLRIVVAHAEGELVGGGTVNVTVPSGELKTTEPFSLKPQGALTVLIRLHVVDQVAGYRLSPVFGSAVEG